jgi:hypothetical protein
MGDDHCWELGRNYNLFAIIADHCNRSGDSKFTSHVVSSARGLPSDISDEVLQDATRGFFDATARPTRAERMKALMDDGIVAPSWVTVEELLAVDWDVATHGEGVGDFLVVLREELVPIGSPAEVRLVFFFDC